MSLSWIIILLLTMGAFTSLILFGMIYFGAKNNKQMNALGDTLNSSNSEMKNNLQQAVKTLETQTDQQQKILSRLKNLETIVTSEAWDAIKKGEDSEHVNLLLHDEELTEITSEEKAENIAKRIKH
jgi:predicted PurR-regulated permease PerM